MLISPDEMRGHLETDLTTESLAVYIAAAENKIVSKHGPHPVGEISTQRMDISYGKAALWPWRDEGTVIAVRENDVDLDVDTDYLVRGGAQLVRLPIGSYWSTPVEVDFEANDNVEERKIALIQLVKLMIIYNALDTERIGDYSMTALDYAKEENRILNSIGTTVWGVA